MFGFLEGKHDPLAPTSVFYGRVAQCFLITIGIVIFSLTLGTFGYHYCGNVDWLDALVNAAMILTGMGPVDKMETTQGKLFAVFYCLYSGIAFLSLVAILMAPIYHRFLHRFHLEVADGPEPIPPRPDPPPITTNM